MQWKPARRAQIDRDGRWTLKRGKKRDKPFADAGIKRTSPSEIVIPAFGCLAVRIWVAEVCARGQNAAALVLGRVDADQNILPGSGS